MGYLKGFPNDEQDVVNIPANAANNTVTTSGGVIAAQTGTLNAKAGTITTATLTTTADTKTTLTITNSECTANSTVFAVINAATVGTTGYVCIQSVVPANGSFVITIANPTTLAASSTVKIRFWIVD